MLYNVITKFSASTISSINSVHSWVHSNLKLPYIKMIPEFHAVRYTDVKVGRNRSLVSDWYSVLADSLTSGIGEKEKRLDRCISKNISSSQRYSDL